MNHLTVFSRRVFISSLRTASNSSFKSATLRYPLFSAKRFSSTIDNNSLKTALSYFRGSEDAGKDVDQQHFNVLKAAADGGSAPAQLCVAYGYTIGKGVAESNENMMKYLMMGVEQNHVDSLLYAADIYYYGLGVVPDPVKCFDFYKRAADLGDVGAQSNVGLRLIAGTGVDKDVKEGMRYIVMSADKGDLNGQYYAGLFYSSGFDGELDADDELSYHYLKIAAERGHADAQFALGVQYYQGTSVVVQSASKAFRYTKLAADQGQPKALFNLGRFHTEGEGTTVDLEEAFRCFKAAADATLESESEGDARAVMKAGQCLMEGTGTPRNETQGYSYYLAAAEMGDENAQYKVATFLESGIGVSPNHAEALRYYTLSAAQGNKEAQYNVGQYYLQGKGADAVDAKNAFVWLKMAADQGHCESQMVVGNMYMSGEGVEKNEQEGKRYHDMLTMVKF